MKVAALLLSAENSQGIHEGGWNKMENQLQRKEGRKEEGEGVLGRARLLGLRIPPLDRSTRAFCPVIFGLNFHRTRPNRAHELPGHFRLRVRQVSGQRKKERGHWQFTLGEMFKNTFQSGFLSILYSLGSKPLQIWDKEVVNGHVKRLQDEDIQSNVLEIVGSNVQSAYITCPPDPAATLGIKLPFLVVIVKNLKKFFTFEIQVLDDKNVRRRFRASNFQVCCDSSKAIYLHHATEDG
ncbi:hypothetical protein EUGRSUZ_G03210 [Eucalyptus grandis]|uniref:Uncharacterized protein n=2 Tax=Eucalyptus grandis TaxID=71139 RepID=A0ACC3K9V4_EUCGR|nr:hypothetical protein EUGRSUZ_G03210 [Eucalyptus grandis]